MEVEEFNARLKKLNRVCIDTIRTATIVLHAHHEFRIVHPDGRVEFIPYEKPPEAK